MTVNHDNHSNRCVLSSRCQAADTSACNRLCTSYIAIHGLDGAGGRIGAANIPDAYRLLTLANSPARESQADICRLAADYVRTFTRQFGPDADGKTQIKSLYLFSREPGTGKTTTAAAILNEWIVAHYIGSIMRDRQPLDRPGYFLDLNNLQTLFNRIHLSVDEDRRRAVSNEFQRHLDAASYTPFIVIDDVGVRSASEAFRAYVHDVINHRVTSGFPMVYTSNIPIEELSDVFDARIADRIRDQCATLHFTGKSRRGMR